jgi:hypothetical protein
VGVWPCALSDLSLSLSLPPFPSFSLSLRYLEHALASLVRQAQAWTAAAVPAWPRLAIAVVNLRPGQHPLVAELQGT